MLFSYCLTTSTTVRARVAFLAPGPAGLGPNRSSGSSGSFRRTHCGHVAEGFCPNWKSQPHIGPDTTPDGVQPVGSVIWTTQQCLNSPQRHLRLVGRANWPLVPHLCMAVHPLHRPCCDTRPSPHIHDFSSLPGPIMACSLYGQTVVYPRNQVRVGPGQRGPSL